jgi:hypothetical protein
MPHDTVYVVEMGCKYEGGSVKGVCLTFARATNLVEQLIKEFDESESQHVDASKNDGYPYERNIFAPRPAREGLPFIWETKFDRLSIREMPLLGADK